MRSQINLIVFVATLTFSTITRAEDNDTNMARSFSHGPTIQFFRLSLVPNARGTHDVTPSILASGAGYSFNFNFLPGRDGSVRWLTIGVPIFATAQNSSNNFTFALSTGVTVGTYNNLFSLGISYDLFNTAPGFASGLFIDPLPRNLAVLINVGFNIGSGTERPASTRSLVPPEPSPPPVYLSF